MTHSTKPYGTMVDKKKKGKQIDPYKAEAEKDSMEIAQAQKKAEAQKAANEDKVAKKVGTFYITNASFPCLKTQDGFTLTVDQYYPEIKVALDKFYEWSEKEIKEAAFKEQMFKDSGIEYIYLNPSPESDRKLEELSSRIK